MAGEKGEEIEVEKDTKGRDIKIRNEFEFADYLMQNILYYHMYVNVFVQGTDSKDKISRLPKVLPFTHVWVLRYSPQNLVKNMDRQFNFYHARSSFLSLIPIFENTLRSFVKRLENKKRIDKLKSKKYYGPLLEWAFAFVVPRKEYLYNGPRDEERIKMIERVPESCLDVDEARRLRNLFMHNRGFFDKKYGIGTIEVPGRQPKLRQEFLREFLPARKRKIPAHMEKFLKEPEQDVPVLLKPEEYIEYSRSHIELLHYLHDLIQRTYFDLKGSGYGYREEQERLRPKRAEWDRIFAGTQL